MCLKQVSVKVCVANPWTSRDYLRVWMTNWLNCLTLFALLSLASNRSSMHVRVWQTAEASFGVWVSLVLYSVGAWMRWTSGCGVSSIDFLSCKLIERFCLANDHAGAVYVRVYKWFTVYKSWLINRTAWYCWWCPKEHDGYGSTACMRALSEDLLAWCNFISILISVWFERRLSYMLGCDRFWFERPHRFRGGMLRIRVNITFGRVIITEQRL